MNSAEFKQLFKQLPENVLAPQIKRLTGMEKDIYKDDIVIVGYPKSGNTWCQYLIAGMVYGINPSQTQDRLVQQLIPDLHTKKFFHRLHSPMFFKSHHWPKPNYRKVIYLVRDGRDVTVSYHHHLTAMNKQPVPHQSIILGHPPTIGAWHSHVESWMSNPYNAEMITVKYEDLKEDGKIQLQRISDFANLGWDDEWVDFVLTNAEFSRMQAREKAAQNQWENTNWPQNKQFVRRGKVGSYKDELPVDVLAMFEEHANDAMALMGYS